MQAANYLNIKSLLDLTCQAVADIIKGKTPEEIRTEFNIEVSEPTPCTRNSARLQCFLESAVNGYLIMSAELC